MVRPTVTIRPSQLLALKPLDPPHDEEEHCEYHDGQPDVREILHNASFRRQGPAY